MTTSSFLSLPAISAIVLYDVLPSGYVLLTISAWISTGVPSASVRAMRP